MNTTSEIKTPAKIIDQVIGQDCAIQMIKKAAVQRRHVLLIGDPGTGKSMLGMALAQLLPKSDLKDLLTYPNSYDEHKPLIKEEPAGKGREVVRKMQFEGKQMFKNQNIFFFIVAIVSLIIPWWVRAKYNSDIMFAAFFIGGIFFLIGFLLFINLGNRMGSQKTQLPKVIVDNFNKKNAPFYDATGAHAGALLGDVLHDPFQSFTGDQSVLINGREVLIGDKIDEIIADALSVEKDVNGYEAVYVGGLRIRTNSGEADILSLNRYDFEGELIRIHTKSNSVTLTKTHKIYCGNFIESKEVKVGDEITSKDGKEKVIATEVVQYSGKLYNLTTNTGDLFVNNLLCKNSGGLGTPANLRVVAGMIHKANKGVLFIDEVATLHGRTQQELLTSIQERKYPITGQSERSAGANVVTEPVPCDFVLVAAGNVETVQQMHPALRSRIRGYGYEVYMKSEMKDTKENRVKLIRFVAQEVRKDGKIPHFSKDGTDAVIEQARRMANRKGHLTLRLRDLGGLVRAAGDIAVEGNSKLVRAKHVELAKKTARPLEQQMADTYIERKKEYGVIVTKGNRIGRVNGLAVIGAGVSFSGILLPIESEITPGGNEKEIVATGKLGEIAKEAVKNVSAIIKKYFGEDIKEKYDIYVQFLQTYEGVEGDSASIAVATSIISALKKIPVKQNIAMTGSLSVRGEVLPIGGVSSKVEAAIEGGLSQVLVPKANIGDIVISKEKLKSIKITPVETLAEVLDEALEWKGHEELRKRIATGD